MSFILAWMLVFIVVVVFMGVHAYVTPPSDFLLDIDGISIGSGFNHKCVVEYKHGAEMGGRARCFGIDDFGETDPPKDATFVQIVAGQFFSCGITVEQNVLCWGRIDTKEVPGLFTQITAAQFYACGVMTDGRISCWGSSPIVAHVPSDPNINFVQVSCSEYHCCALDDKALVHCFSGWEGLLELVPPTKLTVGVNGDVDNENGVEDEEEDEELEFTAEGQARKKNSDTDVLQFKQISVGEQLSCGITLEGSHIQCWGNKKFRGGGVAHFQPGPFRQVSVGAMGICGIYAENNLEDRSKEADTLFCWGTKDPIHITNFEEKWDQVKVSSSAFCGVTMDSALHCYGGHTNLNNIPKDIQIA